jgi:hypothetical protein
MFFLVVVCLWIQFAVTGVCASALPDWCLANRPTAGDFVLSGNCVLNSTELVILRNQTNILAIQGTQRTELCTISKTYVPYQRIQATFQVMGGSKLTLQYIKLHGVGVSVGSQVGVGGEWLSGGGNFGMFHGEFSGITVGVMGGTFTSANTTFVLHSHRQDGVSVSGGTFVSVNTKITGGRRGVDVVKGTFVSVNTTISHMSSDIIEYDYEPISVGIRCVGHGVLCMMRHTFVLMNSGNIAGGVFCMNGAECQILDFSVVAENVNHLVFLPDYAFPGVVCSYPEYDRRRYSSPGKCSTDGTSYISPPLCKPGTKAIVMTKDNWHSQPKRCPICQAGSYSSTINALTCTTCEAGKASSVVGAKRADACQECKAGQYASYIGGTSCTLCATGKSSSIVGAKGPSTCVDCLPGTFSALQGQGMCAVCPVNTISPLGNAMSCDKCPFGKYANPNRTTCNFCKGAPLCYGHGTCDTHKSKCVCFNVDLNGNPTGWTGDACNQCAAQWSSADGKCNSCAHGYKMTSGGCVILPSCSVGYFLSPATKVCQPNLLTSIFYWVGIIVTVASVITLVVKAHLFAKLKRSGKLNPDMNLFRVFFSVVAFGENGSHVIDGNESSAALLNSNDRGVSFVEMGHRRASMDSFLEGANLSHIANRMEKEGIRGTEDLLQVSHDDLEQIGLPKFDQKRFVKAQTRLLSNQPRPRQTEGENGSHSA